MSYRSLASCALVIATSITGCDPRSDPAESHERRFPSRTLDRGLITYEMGPGGLETTNDAPWGGADAIVYSAVVDSDAGSVELEIRGLDLSRIEYRGDMGWPPDGTDAGAVVQVALMGSTEISYRVWSMVGDALDGTAWAGAQSPSDFRAYLFQGFSGGEGPVGTHSLRPEPWGEPEVRSSYNTMDLRLRYDRQVVMAWVRLHASGEWHEGGSQSGAKCPWNVALNNVIAGTADSVWTGECRSVGSDGTGRAVGAWVPMVSGGWVPQAAPGLVQAGITISNWQHARGPYHVTWENVILRGRSGRVPSSATGGGLLHPFGTGGSQIEPRGKNAEFGFHATASGGSVHAAALLRYRAEGIELVSTTTNMVRIAGGVVELEGEAEVNGQGGFRYEFRGVAEGGDTADSVSLEVWRAWPSSRPYYSGFGSLIEGSVEINLPG